MLTRDGRDAMGRSPMQRATDTDAIRLWLMFACCQPTLTKQEQVSLTLHIVGGLTTSEIARALLTPEADLVQRIEALELKTEAVGVPFEGPIEIPSDRLEAVRSVIYLMFNEGYVATGGETLIRVCLCDEAIRLGRILCKEVPEHAENRGLLALMLLQHSRRDARVDDNANLVTLEDQDRRLWHSDEINEGLYLIEKLIDLPEAGPYVLQASIAAVHARAENYQATNWRLLVGLYTQLLRLTPSPVIRLNRAVAIAMSGRLHDGLNLIEKIATANDLTDYHPFHAARADILRRLGRMGEAAIAYRRALSLTRNVVEQRYLSRRLEELRSTLGSEYGARNRPSPEFMPTREVLVMAQLMHASSTGSLVVLSPPAVTAAQETLWYAVYAIALWLVVAVVKDAKGTK